MSCIICNKPAQGVTRKTHVIVKDGPKWIKSKEPLPICFDCYLLGDYKGLACAVIESAIDDLCDKKLTDLYSYGNYKESAIIARRMAAKGFLFGKGIEIWAGLAEIPVPDIRAHVTQKLKEVKKP
jgi:hypothetical protein